jgi:hypothetical protein
VGAVHVFLKSPDNVWFLVLSLPPQITEKLGLQFLGLKKNIFSTILIL